MSAGRLGQFVPQLLLQALDYGCEHHTALAMFLVLVLAHARNFLTESLINLFPARLMLGDEVFVPRFVLTRERTHFLSQSNVIRVQLGCEKVSVLLVLGSPILAHILNNFQQPCLLLVLQGLQATVVFTLLVLLATKPGNLILYRGFERLMCHVLALLRLLQSQVALPLNADDVLLNPQVQSINLLWHTGPQLPVLGIVVCSMFRNVRLKPAFDFVHGTHERGLQLDKS
mmetsp:Transcript_49842/g.132314  ORF Transcript_49842/g.132314 Transcript_49842/m.132314 type:complete len:229 (+) Transcript_49842:3127-3813(+)